MVNKCEFADGMTFEELYYPGFEVPTYDVDGRINGVVRITKTDPDTKTIWLESALHGR